MKYRALLVVLLSGLSFSAQAYEVTCGSMLDPTCQTSKGFQFVRVANGWKDEASGETWFDQTHMNCDHPTAEKFCNDMGYVLPSESDLELADSHGIREVFHSMDDQWVWSSSRDPYSHNFEYGFFESERNVTFYDYPDGIAYARCVSR